MADNEEQQIMIGTWRWQDAKNLDDEMRAEEIFHRVFECLRLASQEKDVSLEMVTEDDMVAVITALLEISNQALIGMAEVLGVSPLSLINEMERTRPRGSDNDD